MTASAHNPEPRLTSRLAGLASDSVEWRPVVYRLSKEADRGALRELLDREGPRIQVFDTLLQQLRDLFKTRNPGCTLIAAEIGSLTREHLADASLDEYGAWIYYPWSKRLVHLLDEAEFAELRTNRNRYKITPTEQAELANKRIGVIGLSVGQSAAVVLALERSFGELRLADFDTLDLSNLNRLRAGVHSLGVSKAFVTAREIAEIDPYENLTLLPQGISEQNVEEFLLGSGKLDIVIEECDSLDVKLLVRHHSRRHRIPVVMDTSDRGMLDIERFDLEPDRPLFHGLAGDLPADALFGLTSEQKIPFVLRILGSQTTSPRLRSSMLEVGSTISTWPQLASAVSLGGAAVADAARRIVLAQSQPSGRFFIEAEGQERWDPAIEKVQRLQKQVKAARPESVWSTLVADAIFAPSGGNSQPWQWLASGDELRLLLDSSRSSGLIDFEYCGSIVALGCAAENLVLAAHNAGLEVEVRQFPPGGGTKHVASFHLALDRPGAELHQYDELYALIPLRRTRRGIQQGRPLDEAALVSLREAVESVPGARVQWITDPSTLDQIGAVAGAAERLRILNQRTHDEMFKELRWTSAEAESTRDGIEVESLELTPSDRAGLELCRDWAILQLVQDVRGGRNLEKISRKQIAGASAVGLITLPDSTPADYFNGGRALQRMWLTATKNNVAIHPLATLPYFFARILRGEGAGFNSSTIEELHGLRTIYESLFDVSGRTAEVLLFRAGLADPTGSRPSLRRPVHDVLSFCG
jgi:molybdopterin/thiamine biosynthesis adenylyltransferase